MAPALQAACNQVETVLQREHELLGGLEFRLEMLRIVLDTDDRWLAPACRDVEFSLDLLRAAEPVRAVRIDVLAGCLGLPPSPKLHDIAQASPEPWTEIFVCHRWALLALIGGSLQSAEDNRARLVDSGVSRRVARLGRCLRRAGAERPDDRRPYDRTGGRRLDPRAAVVAPSRVRSAPLVALDDYQSDRFLLQIAASMALSSLERVVPQSLIDFLS